MISDILNSTIISSAAISNLAPPAASFVPASTEIAEQEFKAEDVYEYPTGIPKPVNIPFVDEDWLSKFGITHENGVYTPSQDCTLMLNFEIDIQFNDFTGASLFDVSNSARFCIFVINGLTYEATYFVLIPKRPVFVGDGDTGEIKFTKDEGGYDDIFGKIFTFSCSLLVPLTTEGEYSFTIFSELLFTVKGGRVVATKI